MRGRAKLHLAKLLRVWIVIFLLLISLIILIYFLTHWQTQPKTPIKTETIASQKIERQEKIQHFEFKGERGKIELKANKYYAGEKGLYYLEGKVEIIDFRKKEGQEVYIYSDKAVYDKDLNHVVLKGKVKAIYKDVTIESSSMEYVKQQEFFKSDHGVSFSSKKLKGSSQKIRYWSRDEKLILKGKIKLEIKPNQKFSKPLFAEGDTLEYNRKQKMGKMEGNVSVVLGKSHGSSDFLEFKLSKDEEQVKNILLKGNVKGSFIEEEKGKTTQRMVEAEQIFLKTYPDLNQVQRLEAQGSCVLKLIPEAGSLTQIQSQILKIAFARDGKMKQLNAQKDVILVEKEGDGVEKRRISGEEIAVNGKLNILEVTGKTNGEARLTSQGSEISASEINLSLQTENLAAKGAVKVILHREKGEKKALGFFTESQPIFITTQEMRYSKDQKRFLFENNVRFWQEKGMIQAQKAVLFEEKRAFLCEGKVQSSFPHKQKEREKEEKIEIAAEKMNYQPQNNILLYEENCSLKARDIQLQSDSIYVYLMEAQEKLKCIFAKGKVVVVQGDREARGEEANYNLEADTIVLTKNPVLVDKVKGTTECDKLTFYLTDGKIVIENKERGRSVTVIKS
jgi:lipopolysaccharide transport protein LptA/LPS export ABC transporter protein LptC